MIYKVIGLMSGSSLDGLDIVFTELQETAGKWMYDIKCAACVEYSKEWEEKLATAVNLPAKDYQLLHTAYGKFTGEKINEFINENNLHHQVNLIASHGHTTFHLPEKKMTHQLGEGAAIAAETKLPVVSDLRAMDIAFGGEGAPIVPLGEKLLFGDYQNFLNIGGIANISIHKKDTVIAYDVCAANRVLNMLANEINLAYDNEGKTAARGKLHEDLLQQLNSLDYFSIPYPKSLANSFGTGVIYPLIKSFNIKIEDALQTYVEHVCSQITKSLEPFKSNEIQKLFITGGGAFNLFLMELLQKKLHEINFEVFLPSTEIIKNKEALIVALLGILRWREQYTVLASVTGAIRNSIGGALWLGNEA